MNSLFIFFIGSYPVIWIEEKDCSIPVYFETLHCFCIFFIRFVISHLLQMTCMSWTPHSKVLIFRTIHSFWVSKLWKSLSYFHFFSISIVRQSVLSNSFFFFSNLKSHIWLTRADNPLHRWRCKTNEMKKIFCILLLCNSSNHCIKLVS